MHSPHPIRALYLALALAILPAAVTAQVSPPLDPDALRAEVRNLQQRGEFEPALALLDSTIQRAPEDTELLHEAYLLLVETHVLYGNVFDVQGQRSTAQLHWDSARDRARQCLENPALRRTEPPAGADYPERGRQIFEDLRREMFGSFVVTSLDPPEAELRFAGEPLDTRPADSEGEVVAMVDYVPVGEHSVLVRQEGYEDQVEVVRIEGGSRVVREYSLQKKKGIGWWVIRGTGAVAVGSGIAWLAGAFDSNPSGTETLDPLPDPPPPPQ